MRYQHYCIYGGQYGSEGKASAAEYLIRSRQLKPLTVFAESWPSAGEHANSLGQTKNVPASCYFADQIILGPDSEIDPVAIIDDLKYISQVRRAQPLLYIHQQATWRANSKKERKFIGCDDRIQKYHFRNPLAVVLAHKSELTNAARKAGLDASKILIPDHSNYINLIRNLATHAVMECTDGVLLDVNFGFFPHVASRTTFPQVAISRNHFDLLDWTYVGVYKSSNSSGLMTPEEFAYSIELATPDLMMWTHLDSLSEVKKEWEEAGRKFSAPVVKAFISALKLSDFGWCPVMGSFQAGYFQVIPLNTCQISLTSRLRWLRVMARQLARLWVAKYVAGQLEHGGELSFLSSRRLLHELMQEILDQWSFTAELIRQSDLSDLSDLSELSDRPD